jgi:hypothetical protein
MTTVSDQIIDALGGTTAVSRMLEAPVQTVHSWRKNGIPPSRFAHLKLAAAAAGKAAEFDQATRFAENAASAGSEAA